MHKNSIFTLGEKIVKHVSEKIRDIACHMPIGKEIGSIGCSGDPTKTADSISEEIVDEIVQQFIEEQPWYRIIVASEELGVKEYGDTTSTEGCFMIIDPLDGSNNLRDWRTPSPYVSTALAMGSIQSLKEHQNFDCIEIAMVKDIFNKRWYFAKKGEGAFVEDFGNIYASREFDLSHAIVGIDMDSQGKYFEYLQLELKELQSAIQSQRRLGASILDFMKVACGEYDAFVSLIGNLKIHDIASAKILVERAGGVFELVDHSFSDCIFKKLLLEKDESVLKRNTFQVIASGNRSIHAKIKHKIIKPSKESIRV